MIGIRLGGEDEVKPRNWARIDCANSNNTRSHTKNTENGRLLHAAPRLLDITVVIFNSWGGKLAGNFRGAAVGETIGWVAFMRNLLVSTVRLSLFSSGDCISRTHRHILIFPLYPHSNIIEPGKPGRTGSRNRPEDSMILWEADGCYSMAAVTQLLISVGITHHRGTQFREGDRRPR